MDPALLFVFRPTVLSVPCSLVVTCWERADLLALLYVIFPCVFAPLHMVSCVRCGILLCGFVIFAFFLTLILFLYII